MPGAKSASRRMKGKGTKKVGNPHTKKPSKGSSKSPKPSSSNTYKGY